MRRWRTWLVLAAKLAVTAGVLWWVISAVRWHDHVVTAEGRSLRVLDRSGGRVQVDGQTGPVWRAQGEFQALHGQVVRPGLATAMRGLELGWFLLAAALLAAQLVLMGVRWWYLLRFESTGVGLRDSMRLMFVGHFLNFFLPGATGGDVVRAYLVTKRTGRRTVAVAMVLVDRFAGLAGMALLAGVMTLATWGSPQTARAAGVVGAIVLVILLAGLPLFSRRVAAALRLDRLIDRLPRRENLHLAAEALWRLPGSPRTAATVAGMTLAVHLLLPAGVACLGQALGLRVPVQLYFLYVPIIYILAAIPISIGGLGLVEGMYIVFFGPSAGLDAAAILALALLARLTPMVLSLPGLAFWLVERRSAAEARAGAAASAASPPCGGSAA